VTGERLSDTEALMWRLESDPWFRSSFGALSRVDGRVDVDYLTARLVRAVLRVPRLRKRLVERPGDNPAWETDPEFELSHHVRHSALPEGSTTQDLLDFGARLVADPLDRSRPLWQFHIIDLPGGDGAVLTKFHHSVTDGEGGVQVALEYLDLDDGRQPVASVDELAAELTQTIDEERPPQPLDALAQAVRDTAGRHLSRWRSLAGEAAMYVADPQRVGDQATSAIETLRRLTDDLPVGPGAADLWAERSRRRSLSHIGIALEPSLDAARRRGGTLNDVLLTAVSMAADACHSAEGATLERLHTSFIMSNRDADTGVGNAFTPSAIELPGAGLTVEDRFALIAGRTEESKSRGSQRSDLQAALAGPARFVPATALSALARRQAGRIDIATSNLRSAPVPLWVGGAAVRHNVPIGPVAGTAANVTLMSYADRADIGVHVDPTAITDPPGFRDALASALEELTGNPPLLDGAQA